MEMNIDDVLNDSKEYGQVDDNMNDNCILVTSEIKAQHKISAIDQHTSSSFFNRLYDKFCHFMEQS